MKSRPTSFLLRFCCIFILLAPLPMRCRAARGGVPSHHHARIRYVDPSYANRTAAPRIHGGFEAPEGKLKFMVFILISWTRDLKDPTMTCSGSLIDEKWVLTAAHCIKARWQLLPSIIVVGGRANLRAYYDDRILVPFAEPVDEKKLGVQERRVVAIHVNPQYSEQTNYNDLALLELDKPFRLDQSVETIPLSNEKMDEEMSCVVAGWGLSDSQVQTFTLMFAQDVHVQTTEMSCTYKKSGPLLCLEEEGSGICRGDSGSPLVCNGTSWGVASFSLSVSKNPKCGDSQEEYYAELYPHLPWLRGTMEGGDKGKIVASSAGLTLFVPGLRLLLLLQAFVLPFFPY